MTIRDLSNNWEGTMALVVRNGSMVLTSNVGAVPPNEARCLRIVEATLEERTEYRLKNA